MKIAYIIDLDGTLYDNSHRQHLIPVDRSNTAGWVAFNSACAEDGLREDMADLVRSILLSGREVIFLTGRGEAAREPTMQRLLKDFNFIEQPTMIMRPMDSHTSASEFKRDAVERIWFSKRWAPYCLIALEDDPSVVEVMRSMGVTVLQIDSKCCAIQTAEVDTAPAQFASLAGKYPGIPEGSAIVPLSTLQWWRKLVELNPTDLAPRIDAYITVAQKPMWQIGGGVHAKNDPYQLVGAGDDLSSRGMGGKS